MFEARTAGVVKITVDCNACDSGTRNGIMGFETINGMDLFMKISCIPATKVFPMTVMFWPPTKPDVVGDKAKTNGGTGTHEGADPEYVFRETHVRVTFP